MGPRNKRRLTIAAMALAVIAAIIVAVVVLNGSSTPAATIAYRGPTDARYDANSRKLVFGMTKQQVRRAVGPPEKVVGRCWQYRVNRVMPNHALWNADRVCFDGGSYSDLNFESNGVWDPKPSIPVFTQ
jgi:hypothetical protein